MPILWTNRLTCSVLTCADRRQPENPLVGVGAGVETGSHGPVMLEAMDLTKEESAFEAARAP